MYAFIVRVKRTFAKVVLCAAGSERIRQHRGGRLGPSVFQVSDGALPSDRMVCTIFMLAKLWMLRRRRRLVSFRGRELISGAVMTQLRKPLRVCATGAYHVDVALIVGVVLTVSGVSCAVWSRVRSKKE